MKIKKWKLVTETRCDVCHKDLTSSNHYSQKFDNGHEADYCDDICGDAYRRLMEDDIKRWGLKEEKK